MEMISGKWVLDLIVRMENEGRRRTRVGGFLGWVCRRRWVLGWVSWLAKKKKKKEGGRERDYSTYGLFFQIFSFSFDFNFYFKNT